MNQDVFKLNMFKTVAIVVALKYDIGIFDDKGTIVYFL